MHDRPLRLLFVCTANMCRSPMAEGIARKLSVDHGVPVEVRSAGILAEPGFRALDEVVTVCGEVGIDLAEHRSQRLDASLVEWADHVLVMENGHAMAVHACDWRAPYKIWKVGDFVGKPKIADPTGGSLRDYRKTRDLLVNAIEVAFDRLVT